MSVRTLLAPQIARLAERGYRVEVVTSPGDDALSGLPGVAAVHQLAMSRSISPLRDARALLAWVRLLRRTAPEAVVAFSPKASLLALVAAWLVRVPARVYSTGGLRLETARGHSLVVLWLTEWVTCAAATKVVANSKSLAAAYARFHLARGKISWTMSRKGVDHHRFNPGSVPDGPPVDVTGPGDLPVVGYVGRVTQDKGLPVLAAALAILTGEGTPVRVLVVGPQEGPESERILADLASSTEHCTVIGAVTDVRAYYSAMDVLVLPSEREGFPNVVLEAAAMGMPAVVSDATGCVDSVDPSTGVVFPAGDARALAVAIRSLLSDDDSRRAMGAAALRRAIRDFEPSRVLDQQLDQMGMGGAPCVASPVT